MYARTHTPHTHHTTKHTHTPSFIHKYIHRGLVLSMITIARVNVRTHAHDSHKDARTHHTHMVHTKTHTPHTYGSHKDARTTRTYGAHKDAHTHTHTVHTKTRTTHTYGSNKDAHTHHTHIWLTQTIGVVYLNFFLK